MPTPRVLLCCRSDNDLWQVLDSTPATDRAYQVHRVDDVTAALAQARPGDGIAVLADQCPDDRASEIGAELWQRTEALGLRVYLEHPSAVPGLVVAAPTAVAEGVRVVVTTDDLAGLDRDTILATHRSWACAWSGPEGTTELLALARVAGYDTAPYGLPVDRQVLLAELAGGTVRVAGGALSRFVTGRYGPARAWGAVWADLLGWLAGTPGNVPLAWRPSVAPRHQRTAPVSPDAEANAVAEVTRWLRTQMLFLREDYSTGRKVSHLAASEGFASLIRHDGSQHRRSEPLRADCCAEAAMVLAQSWQRTGDPEERAEAESLLDLVWSPTFCDPDPDSPTHGLVDWAPGWGVFYGDDNARIILATLMAAAILGEDRWTGPATVCLEANLATTGRRGFRRPNLRTQVHLADPEARARIAQEDFVEIAPHHQAYLWACSLLLHQVGGEPRHLDLALAGLRATMATPPEQWCWTNGLSQELARILLPLAFLWRTTGEEEHREWLERAVDALAALVDESGGVREVLGDLSTGRYAPPTRNESYGTDEAPLVQANGDPACDLLYTMPFALLGLHEAAAALDESGVPGSGAAAALTDRLAGFLVRVQSTSQAHPELAGCWLRGFDLDKWEYWGSSADAGWGAWCVESGWTNTWIPAVLTLRARATTLHDLALAALRR